MEILLKIKFPHFKQEIHNDKELILEGDNKLCKKVKNLSQSPIFMRREASTKKGWQDFYH